MHHAYPDTHTHLYIIIYYRRDKRCRRTRGVLVQCRPAASRTPTHTQTHSLGRHPTLTANRVIILLSTDFIVIILQYILYCRVYNNYCNLYLWFIESYEICSVSRQPRGGSLLYIYISYYNIIYKIYLRLVEDWLKTVAVLEDVL